ncbi:TGS domain-containing protein, partial [Candidatus Woesearchaeota archaeon]|nr:TGS domain-containing protein [Candidatus Woesearchaeota archaeon]
VDIGSHDPVEDVKFLEEELDMWYLGILKKGWEKFARTVVQEKKEIHVALGKQLSGLKVTEEMVEDVIKSLGLETGKPNLWSEEELQKLATELRKLTKPMVIACNKIDVKGGKENFTRLKKEFPDHMLIGCSAESELALREAAKTDLIEYIPGDKDFKIIGKLNEKQEKALEFIKENVLDKNGDTGLQQVLNNAVFDLLKYIAIFPGGVNNLEDSDGNVLPDCFLMPPGITALDFAYRLHTDIGKHFIRAIDVKTKRTVGKEHLLNHRDVVEIIVGR